MQQAMNPRRTPTTQKLRAHPPPPHRQSTHQVSPHRRYYSHGRHSTRRVSPHHRYYYSHDRHQRGNCATASFPAAEPRDCLLPASWGTVARVASVAPAPASLGAFVLAVVVTLPFEVPVPASCSMARIWEWYRCGESCARAGVPRVDVRHATPWILAASEANQRLPLAAANVQRPSYSEKLVGARKCGVRSAPQFRPAKRRPPFR